MTDPFFDKLDLHNFGKWNWNRFADSSRHFFHILGPALKYLSNIIESYLPSHRIHSTLLKAYRVSDNQMDILWKKLWYYRFSIVIVIVRAMSTNFSLNSFQFKKVRRYSFSNWNELWNVKWCFEILFWLLMKKKHRWINS